MGNIKIPQLPPLGRMAAPGDLIAGWDAVLSKTRFIDIAELPFSDGEGGGTVTVLGSPFKVRNTSPSYAIVGADTVITDPRLLGKSDYIVTTTQLQLEFDDDQITYDSDLGTVTILNFQLDDGRHISIYADGVVSESASELYAGLTVEIALLQQIAAPFLTTALGANGGKVWFMGDISTLAGTGWQECGAMRGYFPMAHDPDSLVFNAPVGTPGGSADEIILAAENIPLIDVTGGCYHDGTGAPTFINVGLARGGDNLYPNAHPIGNADPAPIDKMNPYMIGTWIEFVGL